MQIERVPPRQGAWLPTGAADEVIGSTWAVTAKDEIGDKDGRYVGGIPDIFKSVEEWVWLERCIYLMEREEPGLGLCTCVSVHACVMVRV